MARDGRSLGVDLDRLHRIGGFLEDRYVGPGLLAGAQLAVLRRGELAYETTLGLADSERGTKLADDAVFRIYSMTKPITSIAFMMLVEEGLVAVDDPVHRFIPEWRDLQVYEGGDLGSFRTGRTKAPMRMADLLRHTSGLTYDLQNSNSVDEAYRKLKVLRGQTLDEFIASLATLPLIFSPGDYWNYSVSTDVLGYLVGKISGMPFEQFLQERIFDPLGMVDTGFWVPPEKAHRLAACYRFEDGRRVLADDPKTSSFLAPPKLASGGGGLVSTTADYLRFVRMLLGRGTLDGVRIIGPKTLDLMTVNHIPGGRDLTQASVSLFSEAAYSGVGFGLGFAVTEHAAKTLIPGTDGEYFWGGMASTAFFVDPKEQLAMVFMTQIMPSNTYPLRRQLRTMIYSALTETA